MARAKKNFFGVFIFFYSFYFFFSFCFSLFFRQQKTIFLLFFKLPKLIMLPINLQKLIQLILLLLQMRRKFLINIQKHISNRGLSLSLRGLDSINNLTRGSAAEFDIFLLSPPIALGQIALEALNGVVLLLRIGKKKKKKKKKS